MSEIRKFDGSNFRVDGANNDINHPRVMPRDVSSIYPEDREVRGFASKPNEIKPTRMSPAAAEGDRMLLDRIKRGDLFHK